MTAERLPWYVAGPLLGLVIVALRALVNKPFGALGGYIELVAGAPRPRQLDVRAFLLFGLVAGGAIFTLASGGSTPSSSDLSVQFVPLLLAGVAMGFGARTAGGCTSGHGMSGMSLGSPASIAASMTFFGTAVALAQLHAQLFGGHP
jgi:uncharacterized membrane protein YedE/YeeE